MTSRNSKRSKPQKQRSRGYCNRRMTLGCEFNLNSLFGSQPVKFKSAVGGWW